MGWFIFGSSEEEEESDGPKERVETKVNDVTRTTTEYKIEVQYSDGSSRTEYATKYKQYVNHIELYDLEPYLRSRSLTSRSSKGIPSHRVPRIGTNDGEPLIISLSNVHDIDITPEQEVTFVCEDVEYEQHQRQDEEGTSWEKHYNDFEKGDRDYEVEVRRQSKRIFRALFQKAHHRRIGGSNGKS